MSCQNCGYSLSQKDAKFCTACGYKLPAKQNAHVLDLRHKDPQSKLATQNRYNPAQQFHSTLQKESKNHHQRTHKEQRYERALSTPKSHLVSKFGPVQTSSLRPVVLQDQQLAKTVPEAMAPHKSYQINKQAMQSQNVAAAMAQHHERYVPLPDIQSYTQPQPPEQIKDKVHKKSILASLRSLVTPSKRFVQATSTVIVVLLLISYITYLNLPNISFRVAASRAGIEADLPRYKPTDYALDGKAIAYKDGVVSVVFRSKKNGTTLKLVQNQTRLDSNSLYEQYVSTRDSTPTTVHQNGLVIYLYNDDTSATWVNAGKQYVIEGNNLVDREQLLKIASSL